MIEAELFESTLLVYFMSFWKCHYKAVVVIVQNESELFGRTIRVNLAKPTKSKEGSSRPGKHQLLLCLIILLLGLQSPCHHLLATATPLVSRCLSSIGIGYHSSQ